MSVSNKIRTIRFIRKIARESFGFDELRAGQEAAIKSVVSNQDTLAIMPTGSGKSAIYQIAALHLPGSTIVVSPLIALQRDQYQGIADKELGGAAFLNSTLSASARQEVFDSLSEGELEFLLLAPEQFSNPDTLVQIKQAKPSLFVVDEAHCVSEWGHDFRPDYLRLGDIIEELGHPTILALTATASPPVRADIVRLLRMREPHLVIQGFDRPNIWLGARRFEEELHKRKALIEAVVAEPKPGIVYVATRANAENIAAELCEAGVKALPYHAGLKTAERNENQAAFMGDQAEVIVATTAFGMGIDKPGVRFVFHYEISDSVDSYYQEIGRAGRDGEPAKALLFYRPEDLGLRRFFASGGLITADDLQKIASCLMKQPGSLPVEKVQENCELSDTKLTKALHMLEEAGVIELTEEQVSFKQNLANDEIVQTIVEVERVQGNQQQFTQSRIEMIRGYAELSVCRRAYLLNYFGEECTQACGNCDNCQAGRGISSESSAEPFAVNSRVAHAKLGQGTVMRYEGDKMVVLFDESGYKSLAVSYVVEHTLLRAAED